MTKNNELFARRQRRTRYKIRQTAGGKPRLTVFRSGRHIYAQLIDDSKGVTLASASTTEKELDVTKSWNKEAASEVGKRVAERALKAGVTDVVFDRGGYIFHGRIKSLADAARETGLKF
ncbi:50S ribosomal protein L18 [Alphaproteobacteria bacterium SO-S41]|nr:50S ribosomal protein L18 [Alphaproteobacteria bacterium SO-S41]